MTTWLHRISWFAEVSRPLLEHGYLSIGFSDFGDDDCIDGVCGDSGEQYLCERMKQDWGKVPRSRFSLIAFLAGMKKGDRVLVPGHGEFSVYRICEDRAQPIGKMDPQVLAEIKGSANVGLVVDTSCLWRVGPDGKPDRGEKDEKYLDVGFTRKVEPIKVGIPRDGYCDSDLTSRMKMRQTTADISDLDNAVADAISAFKNNRPFDLHGNIVEQAVPPILGLLRNKLTPDQFEGLVKWYFQRCGATQVDTPAKNEREKKGDADIVATFEPIRTILYVQVKHHLNVESKWAVEQVRDYAEDRGKARAGYAGIMWVVSTCEEFSKECVGKAEESGVLLFNGKDFAKLLLDAGISGCPGGVKG
jgi:hypothetical protein